MAEQMTLEDLLEAVVQVLEHIGISEGSLKRLGSRGKLLRNLEEILDYTGMSEALFRKFHKNGFPARQFDGRWFAHTDNIDDFFRAMTKAQKSKNPAK